MHKQFVGTSLVAIALASACGFDSQLAPRVAMTVAVDASGMVALESAEGYQITVTRCRGAIEDLELTTSGEMHASLLERMHAVVVPTAHAHPGHTAGGEVIGELAGRFVVDFLADGELLGDAELLADHYDGANFSLTRASTSDGLDQADALLGHTFEIAGTATRDGTSWTFQALVDEDEGRQIVGLPMDFDAERDHQAVLGLQMRTVDPVELDTVFDGVDFALLAPGGGDVELVAGSGPYNVLRRTLETHDHYGVSHP
jgi:hypothetical protein